MANIQPYVDDILDAVYGEEVRSSIANALTAMNDDITDDTTSAWAAAAAAEAAVTQIADVRTEIAEIAENLELRNLLKDPVSLTSTYWDAYYPQFTRNVEDPEGGYNATRLAPTSGRETYLFPKADTNSPINRANQVYTFSVWLRADSAKTITGAFNGVTLTFDLTTAWKKYAFQIPVTTIVSGAQLFIGGGSSFTSGWIEIYYPCVVYSDMAQVAYSGSYDDLTDTPELADVATSGSYTDLTDTPDGTYYKIINTNYANISYSGASVPAGNSVTLTGTLTLDSATTSVRALPAECNIGWFNSPWSSGRVNVEISGTTATITASVKNATGNAITSATARVFIIQLAK